MTHLSWIPIWKETILGVHDYKVINWEGHCWLNNPAAGMLFQTMLNNVNGYVVLSDLWLRDLDQDFPSSEKQG